MPRAANLIVSHYSLSFASWFHHAADMLGAIRHFAVAFVGLAAIASGVLPVLGDSEYTTAASYVGGAGGNTTNAEYELRSSWRQPTQTSISSGGAYDHVSGFLGAFSDAPRAFRIISFGVSTNGFQTTIPTKPDYTYTIQFSDDLSGIQTWHTFVNTNHAVGKFTETNATAATFTFTDDFTPATSGGPSLSFYRFYRIISTPSSSAP